MGKEPLLSLGFGFEDKGPDFLSHCVWGPVRSPSGCCFGVQMRALSCHGNLGTINAQIVMEAVDGNVGP